MYRPTTCLILILLIELCSAYFYTSEPFAQQIEQYGNGGGGYQFAYETGSSHQPDEARSFREESRDEYGNVVGKYGYYDAYGQLRVVKYRAGADGYHAEGDTGVGEETLRQQRLLYANDEATQIQQKAWQEALNGGSSSSSSSSSAAASAAAAASASSSSQFYGGGSSNVGGGFVPQQPTTVQTTFSEGNDAGSSRQDWTTINTDQTDVINQQYNVKGGGGRVVERLIAAPPVKSPIQIQYQTSANQFGRQVSSIYNNNNQYTLPFVRQYSSTTYHTVPGAIQPTTSARYVSQTTKSIQSNKGIGKSSSAYTNFGGFKSPASARYTEVHQQVPAFKPLTTTQNSYHSSSSAAASAAASASSSSSSSSFGGSPRAFSSFGGTKGGGAVPSNTYRSARYSIPGNGQGHSRVSFKQFGVRPFQYSYNF